MSKRKRNRHKSHHENIKKEEVTKEEEIKCEGSYLQQGCDFVGQSIKGYLTKENLIIAGGEAFNYLMLTIDPYQKELSDIAAQAKKLVHTGSAVESIAQSKGINVENIPGYHACNTYILNSQMGYSEAIDEYLGLDTIQNHNKLMGQIMTAAAISVVSRVPTMVSTIGHSITSTIRFFGYGNEATEKVEQTPIKSSEQENPNTSEYKADGTEKFKDYKDKYNSQKNDEEELSDDVSISLSTVG
ncbi:hypothetical protein J2N86_12320 [Legionella lytica]|uniref:Uncharacterized protein n=1 Tax=Legionella lytica TaxID=96232 RepID=A0ABY4Y755_9GAMM|nr:hypothetical protein [Legionella lytica]USQ13458.1 hypothetical protein J2N86_12320 [Legionella lytica]